MSTLEPDVQSALVAAVQTARARLGDPCAPVVFVMTSSANAALARRALGARVSFIRVRFTTVDEVVSTLGRAAPRGDGLRRVDCGGQAGKAARKLVGQSRLRRLFRQ